MKFSKFHHSSSQKQSRQAGLSNSASKSQGINASEGETNLAAADDSDYYTPEDPHTTILSPLCPEKVRTKNFQYFCTKNA